MAIYEFKNEQCYPTREAEQKVADYYSHWGWEIVDIQSNVQNFTGESTSLNFIGGGSTTTEHYSTASYVKMRRDRNMACYRELVSLEQKYTELIGKEVPYAEKVGVMQFMFMPLQKSGKKISAYKAYNEYVSSGKKASIDKEKEKIWRKADELLCAPQA